MKRSMFKQTIFATAGLLGMLLTAAPAPVRANPVAAGVVVTAPLTVATAGVAVAASVVANEAFAKKPFGPHGEGMRALKAVANAPRNLIKQWFPHW